MRIKLSFGSAFPLDDCWFGFELEKELTVADLCKEISDRFRIGSIFLEMDGCLLLDEDQISVLLRDDDLLIVQRANEAHLVNGAEDIKVEAPDKISYQVKIGDGFSDSSQDTASNEIQSVDQKTQISSNTCNSASDAPIMSTIDSTNISHKSSPKNRIKEILDDGQVQNVGKQTHAAENVVDRKGLLANDIKEDNEKDLFVPIPEFSDDELDDSFKKSKDNLTKIVYTTESKFRIDGLREKGTKMHFEQVQRKGGWMDYGGNTMEWNPPESKQGWNVEPPKLYKSDASHELDHWNTRNDKSDTKPLKKKRYDYETFSRGSPSRQHKVSTVKKPIDLAKKSKESVPSESKDKKQGPGYCHISGLCKPIKISIFSSFLVKSGITNCFFDESSSMITSFDTVEKMDNFIKDFSGKSLMGCNPKTCCTFRVLSAEEFEDRSRSSFKKKFL